MAEPGSVIPHLHLPKADWDLCLLRCQVQAQTPAQCAGGDSQAIPRTNSQLAGTAPRIVTVGRARVRAVPVGLAAAGLTNDALVTARIIPHKTKQLKKADGWIWKSAH